MKNSSFEHVDGARWADFKHKEGLANPRKQKSCDQQAPRQQTYSSQNRKKMLALQRLQKVKEISQITKQSLYRGVVRKIGLIYRQILQQFDNFGQVMEDKNHHQVSPFITIQKISIYKFYITSQEPILMVSIVRQLILTTKNDLSASNSKKS